MHTAFSALMTDTLSTDDLRDQIILEQTEKEGQPSASFFTEQYNNLIPEDPCTI